MWFLVAKYHEVNMLIGYALKTSVWLRFLRLSNQKEGTHAQKTYSKRIYGGITSQRHYVIRDPLYH